MSDEEISWVEGGEDVPGWALALMGLLALALAILCPIVIWGL